MRVVIADDSLLIREGVQRVLTREPEIEVVAECADLPQLMTAVGAHEPDVVVTDIRMPPTSTDEGIQAATRLRESHPGIGVVVLSQYGEPAYATPLLAQGSSGRAYLLKERVGKPGQLVEAVRAVNRGDSVIDPAVVDAILTDSMKQRSSPLTRLSQRERDVLAHIAQGKSNAAVGQALFLSEKSVEKHINVLFAKLGLEPAPDVNRRVLAVLLYLAETPLARLGG
jgi:DNA-binding NarL/FixJ family response regulator